MDKCAAEKGQWRKKPLQPNPRFWTSNHLISSWGYTQLSIRRDGFSSKVSYCSQRNFAPCEGHISLIVTFHMKKFTCSYWWQNNVITAFKGWVTWHVTQHVTYMSDFMFHAWHNSIHFYLQHSQFSPPLNYMSAMLI